MLFRKIWFLDLQIWNWEHAFILNCSQSNHCAICQDWTLNSDALLEKLSLFSIIIFLLKRNKTLLSDLSIKFNRSNFFTLNYLSIYQNVGIWHQKKIVLIAILLSIFLEKCSWKSDLRPVEKERKEVSHRLSRVIAVLKGVRCSRWERFSIDIPNVSLVYR